MAAAILQPLDVLKTQFQSITSENKEKVVNQKYLELMKKDAVDFRIFWNGLVFYILNIDSIITKSRVWSWFILLLTTIYPGSECNKVNCQIIKKSERK